MGTRQVTICTSGLCGECYRCRLEILDRQNATLRQQIESLDLDKLDHVLDRLEDCVDMLRTILEPAFSEWRATEHDEEDTEDFRQSSGT